MSDYMRYLRGAGGALPHGRLLPNVLAGSGNETTADVAAATADPDRNAWAVVGFAVLATILGLMIVWFAAMRLCGRMVCCQIMRLRLGSIMGTSVKVQPQRRRSKHLWQIDLKEVRKIHLIGQGQFGSVYKSEWRGKAVALKVLKSDKKRKVTADAMLEFMSEVDIMLNLRHPNVLMFLGASVTPPNLAIITEVMDRGSLFGVFHNHKVPPNFLRGWNNRMKLAIDVCLGMNYLHSMSPKIVHRDLKTPNCLVNSSWDIRVADFGLTKIKSEIKNQMDVGNPIWSAPEIFASGPISEKVDVYSFGIVLWEVITLEAPYQDFPLKGLPVAIAEGLRPPIPDKIPAGAQNLLKKCWDIDPEKRPTFEYVLNELRGAKVDQVSVELGMQANVEFVPRCFDGVALLTEAEESKMAASGRGSQTGSIMAVYVDPIEGTVTESTRSGGSKSAKDKLTWDLNPKQDLKFGKRLGEGMSGEVYMGKFKGEEVAIKKIYFTSMHDEAMIDFRNESKLMKKMSHPNVRLRDTTRARS